MKKILLAFADNNLPAGAFEFARQLNENDPVLLIGVFLRQISYSTSSQPTYFEGLGFPSYAHKEETFSKDVIKKKIEWFESLCQKNGIEYRVHQDTDDFAMHELKKETRFADIILLSAELFYNTPADVELSEQLKTILRLSECPVLIIPAEFKLPENIIFAYDGTESSAYALKQFAYVFPEFCNKNVLVVYAASYGEKKFPEEVLIHELAARHFNDLNFLKLDNVSQFSSWLYKNKKGLLVTGSYGRSDISEIFKKSFVTDIIRDHRIPVFIAHK
jgi:nucleotide-binding universal stress UspA family protein